MPSINFDLKSRTWLVQWWPNSGGLRIIYSPKIRRRVSFPESSFQKGFAERFALEFVSFVRSQLAGVIEHAGYSLHSHHFSSSPLTHRRLLQILAYDEESGRFIRKLPSSSLGVSLANTVAGRTKLVAIDGVKYLISRLLVFYIEGWMPPPNIRILFIDGDKSNLVYENLRKV